METASKILYEGGQGEIIEKKSRFIANIFPVTTEEEALEKITAMRKKYYDARHNCFAYILGENKDTVRRAMTGNHQERPADRCWIFWMDREFIMLWQSSQDILEELFLVLGGL